MAELMSKRWAFKILLGHLGLFDTAIIKALLDTAGLQPNCGMSCGKWISVNFLLFKLGHVYPFLAQAFIGQVRQIGMARLSLYNPTGDVMYVGTRCSD